jgi:hypothetical protein
VVSNGSGSATSTAILTVILPPQIDYLNTTPGTSGIFWYQPSSGALSTVVTRACP